MSKKIIESVGYCFLRLIDQKKKKNGIHYEIRTVYKINEGNTIAQDTHSQSSSGIQTMLE